MEHETPNFDDSCKYDHTQLYFGNNAPLFTSRRFKCKLRTDKLPANYLMRHIKNAKFDEFQGFK